MLLRVEYLSKPEVPQQYQLRIMLLHDCAIVPIRISRQGPSVLATTVAMLILIIVVGVEPIVLALKIIIVVRTSSENYEVCIGEAAVANGGFKNEGHHCRSLYAKGPHNKGKGLGL